jgi:hypothetical protein
LAPCELAIESAGKTPNLGPRGPHREATVVGVAGGRSLSRTKPAVRRWWPIPLRGASRVPARVGRLDRPKWTAQSGDAVSQSRKRAMRRGCLRCRRSQAHPRKRIAASAPRAKSRTFEGTCGVSQRPACLLTSLPPARAHVAVSRSAFRGTSRGSPAGAHVAARVARRRCRSNATPITAVVAAPATTWAIVAASIGLMGSTKQAPNSTTPTSQAVATSR